MKPVFWASALLLLAVGCSGSTDDSMGKSVAEQKREAANSVASGDTSADVCAENGWYGDGVCDSFCADNDTDCAVVGEPILCAEFIELEDGVCSRQPSDPCIFQDPDCNLSTPGDPGDDTACALIAELPNGTCNRSPDDPCAFQDPDCGNGGGAGGSGSGGSSGGYDCDVSQVTCEIAVNCPDGEVPTANGLCYGPCVPKELCAEPEPVVCAAYIEESDGVCSRAADDPCRSQDPDCVDDGGAICLEYIEAPDGVCGRASDDPCIFQDPDCSETQPAP